MEVLSDYEDWSVTLQILPEMEVQLLSYQKIVNGCFKHPNIWQFP